MAESRFNKPDDVTPGTRSRQDEYSPFLHGRIGLLIFKNCQSRQTPAVLCRRDCQDKRKSHVFRFLGLIKRPIHLAAGDKLFIFASLQASSQVGPTMSSNMKTGRRSWLVCRSNRAPLVVEKDDEFKNGSCTREGKISDSVKYGKGSSFRNLQSGSRFLPKLVSRNRPIKNKNVDGVICLTVERGKKYLSRAQIDPTAPSGRTICTHFRTPWSLLPGLSHGKNSKVLCDNIEKRSFCDSLSSLACSSFKSSGSSSSSNEVGNCFISKRSSVLQWVNALY